MPRILDHGCVERVLNHDLGEPVQGDGRQSFDTRIDGAGRSRPSRCPGRPGAASGTGTRGTRRTSHGKKHPFGLSRPWTHLGPGGDCPRPPHPTPARHPRSIARGGPLARGREGLAHNPSRLTLPRGRTPEVRKTGLSAAPSGRRGDVTPRTGVANPFRPHGSRAHGGAR